jgi:hypothetical protein
MKKKKPTIPDISEILDMIDEKLKFSIKHPSKGKEKAMDYIEENEERITASVLKDFTTITLGDYINAAQVYNREMMGSKLDATQELAFFTLFAFEERAKRLSDHYQHIN